MSVEPLPLPAVPRTPRARLVAAHERRAAVRALASRAHDAADCALLIAALDLDPADGVVSLPAVEVGPVLTAPPARQERPDQRPVGLRQLPPPGPISRPRPGRQPRQPRPAQPAPADGLCPVGDCRRPWKHRGVHSSTPPLKPAVAPPRQVATRIEALRRRPQSTPTPLDPAEVVRRYQSGEGLTSIATALHVGVRRIRLALAEQGVTIRSRGDVLGQRGPLPRPLDEQECIRLYQSGLDTNLVARHLGVKQARVRDVLRSHRVLKRQPGTTVPLDDQHARRLYATGLSVAQVASRLGVRAARVADVLRSHGELRPRGKSA